VGVVCVWGVAMALADATSLSLLSRLLEPRTLGRTVSVMESLKLGLEGLGALLAPALVAATGVRPALLLAGIPLPLTVLASLPRLHHADETAAGRGAVVGLLHRVPSLRRLDMATLESVAARARAVEVSAGGTVLRQGEPGESFYVVASGHAEVTLDGFSVGRIGPGADFGARALLRGAPRSATVTALTDMVLYAVDAVSFLSAITGRPPEELTEADFEVGRRSFDPTGRPVAEVLGGLACLHDVAPEQLERLGTAAVLEQWKPGTVIVGPGEPSDALYVLMSGTAQTSVDGRQVSELFPGDAFGEIGVLHGVPRTAKVQAAVDATTLRVPAEAVLSLVARWGDPDGIRRLI